MNTDIRKACTKNRAEELGFDVWEHFAIPLFYDQLDIGDTSKASIIVGGRGCGKTMLLRYLSHQSMFSTKREKIDPAAFKHLGLYWKVDTQFANVLFGRSIEPDVWASAFSHFTALVIVEDAIHCLESLARCSAVNYSFEELEALKLDSPADFDSEFSSDAHEIARQIQTRIRRFQTWANNPRTQKAPIFLPGMQFIAAVLKEIVEKVDILRDSKFFVYIDEYENLREYQQRNINTCMKHSEHPVIFNIATKRNGMRTNATVGDECITEIADYRSYDLDKMLETTDFELFAAEILFFRFATMAGAKDLPIDPVALRDSEQLPNRTEIPYRQRVINAAKSIFPGLSEPEMASHAFADPAMLSQLTRSIESALSDRGSDLPAADFLSVDYPQASFVVPALLRRKSLDPVSIRDDFAALKAGNGNRFSGSTNWVHNNFIGCFLQAYVPFSRTCPFYAGFDSFISIAKGNLRHFLEMCHTSLKRVDQSDGVKSLQVPISEQAESARQTSSDFLREVRSFGHSGNQLWDFANGLGRLFAAAHKRPTQSEPEINHFSIIGGAAALDEEERELLVEATKWSVLFEFDETKIKGSVDGADSEWMLAPIYAPHFNITFRKKRCLELARDDVRRLMTGDTYERTQLIKKFEKRWAIDVADQGPTLFDGLHES